MVSKLQNINVSSTQVNQSNKNTAVNNKVERSLEFGKILEGIKSTREEIKISAHAADRMKERNISLTETDMTNIRAAIDNIRSKGGKEALILYKDVAYITSVRNNTIITAVDSDSLKENVFTNIDSALIL